jgi:hypothetical protein
MTICFVLKFSSFCGQIRKINHDVTLKPGVKYVLSVTDRLITDFHFRGLIKVDNEISEKENLTINNDLTVCACTLSYA